MHGCLKARKLYSDLVRANRNARKVVETFGIGNRRPSRSPLQILGCHRGARDRCPRWVRHLSRNGGSHLLAPGNVRTRHQGARHTQQCQEKTRETAPAPDTSVINVCSLQKQTGSVHRFLLFLSASQESRQSTSRPTYLRRISGATRRDPFSRRTHFRKEPRPGRRLAGQSALHELREFHPRLTSSQNAQGHEQE